MNKEKFFALIQYIIPQHFVSKLVGNLAESKLGFIKNTFIKFFLKNYDIKMQEALQEDPFAYQNFNDFFTRQLKPTAREIDENPMSMISPVDGKISQVGVIEAGRLIQAKGIDYSLLDLLGKKQHLSEKFYGGNFATIYLSPSDYHRIHIPLSATLVESIFVPGRLFSVNEATTNYKPKLFTKNERLICIFKDEKGAEFALILVGAMIVGSIETLWSGQITPKSKKPEVLDMQIGNQLFAKGDEIAKFKLGSTVILLTPKSHSSWKSGIIAGEKVKLGQAIGTLCS